MAKNAMHHARAAADFVARQLPVQPRIGLVLGSGLGVLANILEQAITIDYAQIPHFPLSTVQGHAGQLAVGNIADTPVLLMNGRFHLYEGYSAEIVAFPIKVMKLLGIETLLVTNAAGGINTAYIPGDLMLIRDHINFTFRNSLIGPNEIELGTRFPDMSAAYSGELRNIARSTAEELNIPLHEGVYAGMLGPSYETPAEIKMLRQLGADAVGMSTVLEVIAARHMGIRVLGISCISNMAAGMLDQPLSHSEVMETTGKVKAAFLQLIIRLIPQFTE